MFFGIRTECKVQNSSGEYIKQKKSITYLGASICADGSVQSELNRRIGMASADFKLLDVLWTHTNVTRKDKYKIYLACIISKLLYGLQTAWLTKVQVTKLDGFHATCVRRIVGVKHSYWSRISNVEVLSYVNAVQLSKLLMEQRLLLFGKVFRKPPHDVIRQTIFADDSDALQAHSKRRRRGRPKLIWAVGVRKIAIQVADDNLYSAMTDEKQWGERVRKFCRAPCSTFLAT